MTILRLAPEGAKLPPEDFRADRLARELGEIHATLLELAIQMRHNRADRKVQRKVGKALQALWSARTDLQISQRYSEEQQ